MFASVNDSYVLNHSDNIIEHMSIQQRPTTIPTTIPTNYKPLYASIDDIVSKLEMIKNNTVSKNEYEDHQKKLNDIFKIIRNNTVSKNEYVVDHQKKLNDIFKIIRNNTVSKNEFDTLIKNNNLKQP